MFVNTRQRQRLYIYREREEILEEEGVGEDKGRNGGILERDRDQSLEKESTRKK